jgi:hypothetical protein
MNKKIVASIAVVIVAGAGLFYGGMKYAEGKSPGGQFVRGAGGFQGAGTGGFRSGTGGGTRIREGAVAGEIILRDSQSITVKLNDGGSKIIFVSDAIGVAKSVPGSVADLQVGTKIMANGTPNTDGSITAQTIQLYYPQLTQ